MNQHSIIQKAMAKLSSDGLAAVQPAVHRFAAEKVESLPQPGPRVENERKYVRIDRSRLRNKSIITPDIERSRTIEEYRLIKRALLTRHAMNEGKGQNLILVTSSTQGEGKTFTSLNLAMSIALEKDYRVLLIDCDLTRPALMETLGIASDEGLIDVLTDAKRDLSNVLIKTDIDNLTVLPPGKRHPLGTELLASNRMSRLLEELSQRYKDRIIIIDAPPVLATSETSVLAPLVGQIVFVIQSERTSRDTVKEGLNLISKCNNISLLLNRTPSMFAKNRFGLYYEEYHQKRL